MKMNRIHFFLPKDRIDTEIQTYFDKNPRSSQISLYEKAHRETQKMCYLNYNGDTQTEMERILIASFFPNVEFCLTQLQDENFDVLTPPKNQYHDSNVELSLEFYEDSFTAKNLQNHKTFTFHYDSQSEALVRSIQFSVVDKPLLTLLERLEVSNFIDGNIIIEVIDYRFLPELRKRIKLKISYEVLQSMFDQADLQYDDILESESQMLLSFRPIICTDPSPDVSRMSSFNDFRQKMWCQPSSILSKNHETITSKNDFSHNISHVTQPKKIETKPLREKIIIPEVITSLSTSKGFSINFNNM
ncbi:hypothetical protein TRFO_06380 [Tritrichomonas foetus]|uniref:Spt20-like SEP domain-containing protein n=1 Tax=Tritrichomonas foetus TaxID=1144522 RepID=A0A1J4K4P1_9EUKA|nr:hypothetical protein TRFO_06380 [Tritrichomonas foetus]|eukprot:OHT04469.1 hypothetical protein TRFO_06380 [Tritrichomonas foetus]